MKLTPLGIVLGMCIVVAILYAETVFVRNVRQQAFIEGHRKGTSEAKEQMLKVNRTLRMYEEAGGKILD